MNNDLKLLIVEDDEATNYIYKYNLKKIGFTGELQTAINGENALEILAGNAGEVFEPTVIFLDINMPRMNGFEFLDALKESQSKIPAIYMLTNSLNPDDKELAEGYPEVVEFLGKPLNEEILKATLERHS